MKSRRIFVVGSLNMDLLGEVERLPRPGETITSQRFSFVPGGKGANQARAAARLQAPVIMIGKVGDDSFGSALRASLRDDGVDVRHVTNASGPTGTAAVFLLSGGENAIVISPGANSQLEPDEAAGALSDLAEGDLLLCQLETPLPIVQAALQHARAKGAITILDPAPARALPPGLLRSVDILTPNEVEASDLAPDGGIQELAEQTGGAVIVKRGSEGCTALFEGKLWSLPAFPVEAVDTTAAGDTFNGALAAALAADQAFSEALRFASAAAAISVTRKGAAQSAPALSEVRAFLDRHTIVGSR